MLTTNPVIDCALLAWFLAQFIKVLLSAAILRKLDGADWLAKLRLVGNHIQHIVPHLESQSDVGGIALCPLPVLFWHSSSRCYYLRLSCGSWTSGY